MSGTLAANRTITAANSIYMLTVPRLTPAPQMLRGFSADAAFDTDASETAETVKGIDGRFSAGFVPYVTRQTITIMPDSATCDLFEAWLEAQKIARDVFFANATITLPSTGRTYILTKGVLSSWLTIPPARKTLQARQGVIIWDNISPES